MKATCDNTLVRLLRHIQTLTYPYDKFQIHPASSARRITLTPGSIDRVRTPEVWVSTFPTTLTALLPPGNDAASHGSPSLRSDHRCEQMLITPASRKYEV